MFFTVAILPRLALINPEFEYAASALMGVMGETKDFQSLILNGSLRRLSQPGTWLSLLGILTVSISLLYKTDKNLDHTKKELSSSNSKPINFTIILIIFGALMVLAPEFIYLRDFFGTRINTVFKFYYQTWILWSIAAAFSSVLLLRSFKGIKNIVISILIYLSIFVGFIYTGFAFADVFRGDFSTIQTNWRIDGSTPSDYLNPDEALAVDWLWKAPRGVITEAIGGSYSQYARISSHSGQITLLGWEFHETQWRGSSESQGTRNADTRMLYETSSWEVANEIINKYQIEYVFIGSLELKDYRVNETKFIENMSQVFDSGDVRIYQVR